MAGQAPRCSSPKSFYVIFPDHCPKWWRGSQGELGLPPHRLLELGKPGSIAEPWHWQMAAPSPLALAHGGHGGFPAPVLTQKYAG